jgi:nitroreductase
VLWAATRASSANNTQPWDFVVVQDGSVRQRIADAFAHVPGAASARMQANPPADDGLASTERRTRAGALNLLSTIGQVPVFVFVCGANVYPAAEPDISYMYSAVYAAAQNMIIAARALGLGAVFTTIHRWAEPQLRTILEIPDDRTIAVTLPIGWPARSFGPLTRRPLDDVVHRDHW